MIPKLDHYKAKWKVQSDDVIKPGLDSIRKVLQQLNNPQESLQIVHLAGTNGKGSTLTFIENIARQHGLIVGKFMSPCIIDVHDQIQIDSKPITPSEMDNVFSEMNDANISGQLTDFELLTCAAFIHFKNKKVDLVLVEAGMGGREDSTNVVSPIVSVITSIALEHTKFLGNSIQSIAKHKAGIIKKNKPVIIGELPNEAVNIVNNEANLKDSPIFCFGKHFHVSFTEESDTYTNHAEGIQLTNLQRALLGKHQGVNMALAITAFLEVAKTLAIKIDIEKIREGIKQSSVPFRFEQVMDHVYFDGAHNPASAEKLVETIQHYFPNETIRFCIGMLADKDVKSVLHIFEQISDEFYFVDFSNTRAMKAEEMLKMSKAVSKQIITDPYDFLQQANSFSGKTFVAGSLYLLTEIRRQFLFID